MSITNIVSELIDNGGRRIGVKRREFSYTNHLPNGRSEKDRRSGKIIFKKIQRPENDLREGIKRRSGLDRRIAFTKVLVT